MGSRRRLDTELVRRNLAPSREAARRLIAEGRVLVAGAPTDKAARQVDPADDVKVTGDPPPFVSRAGEKLAAALETFGVDPTGRHCLDVGSSTGGFTDCLLQRGAASVTAVDVGTHQLHERLRSDRRVDVREQTDIRRLRRDTLTEPPSLVVADVSFISLRLVLPAIAALGTDEAILLIKPQFEAGRRETSRGRGIIDDPAIWRRVIGEVVGEAERCGLRCSGLAVSALTGRAGNVEFVAYFVNRPDGGVGLEERIDEVVAAATRENMPW